MILRDRRESSDAVVDFRTDDGAETVRALSGVMGYGAFYSGTSAPIFTVWGSEIDAAGNEVRSTGTLVDGIGGAVLSMTRLGVLRGPEGTHARTSDRLPSTRVEEDARSPRS